MSDTPDNKGKTPRRSNDENLPAKEHGKYAKDGRPAESRPHEKGDFEDPGKRQTGRGNASKGPWAEQGGAGHGENYGARDPEPEKNETS